MSGQRRGEATAPGGLNSDSTSPPGGCQILSTGPAPRNPCTFSGGWERAGVRELHPTARLTVQVSFLC